MMRSSWRVNVPALLSVTLTLSGCELLEEIPWHTGHVGAEDAASDPDAGPALDAASAEEAGEPDGGGAETDTGADAALDAAPNDAGCGDAECEADAGQPCAADDDCAPDEYCSREGTCKRRCDALGACMGPEIAIGNDRLVTDGVDVCYAADDRAAADPAQQLVQAWDGSAATPRTIASAITPRVLLVTDGYCYFSTPALRRASLAEATDELIQDLPSRVRRAWLSPEYVWWTAPAAEGLAVFRLARTQDATPELVAEVPASNVWEAGNSTHLFRRFSPATGSCAVVMAPIADLSAEVTMAMSYSRNCAGVMLADERSVFFNQYTPANYNLYRIDFSDLARQVYTNLFSYGEPSNYQLQGDWIYAQAVRDTAEGQSNLPPYAVRYVRASRAGGPLETLFVPEPRSVRKAVNRLDLDDLQGGMTNAFAVLDQRLVFMSTREPRLLVAQLPAAQ